MSSARREQARNSSTARRVGRALRRRLRDGIAGLQRLRTGLPDGVAGGGANGSRAVESEDIIWIFCTARSGSTWLASMMGDIHGCVAWNEPLVGALFGQFYYVRAAHRRASNSIIMGQHHRDVWLRGIRSMVLDGAAVRYPGLPEGGYLVVKEPNGSIGAPLLMEALPESRMVLLVRDPRDVIASALDSARKGSWSTKRVARKLGRESAETLADTDPDAFVERQAKRYAQDVGKAKEAYEAHVGRKALVRYEDLRSDTPGAMRRLCSDLGVAVGGEELARVIEEHSWERIPEKNRGEGKFYRKATPGGWSEDLTGEQARAVERVTARLLAEFYP